MKKLAVFLVCLLTSNTVYAHELIKREYTTFYIEMQFFAIRCDDGYDRCFAMDYADPLVWFEDEKLPLGQILDEKIPLTREKAIEAFGEERINQYCYSEKKYGSAQHAFFNKKPKKRRKPTNYRNYFNPIG